MSRYAGYTVSGLSDKERERLEHLAADHDTRRRVAEFVVPARRGRAFVVERHHILRVICSEGPQVADFNKDDPRQMFWSGRTRILQGAHLTVGDRLWSTPPKMEPMVAIAFQEQSKDWVHA